MTGKRARSERLPSTLLTVFHSQRLTRAWSVPEQSNGQWFNKSLLSNGRGHGKPSLAYPLPPKTLHLCVVMQSAERGWPTAWMARVLWVIEEIVQRHPERTVFSQFITPLDAGGVPGMWRH